jgi:hypothetical protein
VRRALVVAAVLAWATSACSPRSESIELALEGDLLALQVGDERLRLCALGAVVVGSPDLQDRPACAQPELWASSGRWSLVGDHVLEVRDVPVTPELEPECRTGCSSLLEWREADREGQLLAAPAPMVAPALGRGDWVVWVDRRGDVNGLCRWPPGDEDCAADLYALHRPTGEVVRVTDTGTVLWPAARSAEAFALDGDLLVYVDRRDAPPECLGLRGLKATDLTCPTQLRWHDLATRRDGLLLTNGATLWYPARSGGVVTWIEGGGEAGRARLRARAAEGPPAVLAEDLQELSYSAADGWVMWREDGALWARDLATQHQVQLTARGEPAHDPHTSRGRAVWHDGFGRVVGAELEDPRPTTLWEH